ncbi:MAG TPA: ATP-binding cassette domain-containing protein, partial [Pyrinomonadaceae bacterium]
METSLDKETREGALGQAATGDGRAVTAAPPVVASPARAREGRAGGDETHSEVKADVQGLSFFYGQKQALNDINMTFPAHRVTAIIGPSGCGKSTLL